MRQRNDLHKTVSKYYSKIQTIYYEPPNGTSILYFELAEEVEKHSYRRERNENGEANTTGHKVDLGIGDDGTL